VKVNPQVLESLLDEGFIPVVAPVSLNTFERQPQDRLLLNINGDTVAGEIATAMKAEQLVFLTDVDGIKNSAGNIMHNIDPAEIEGLLSTGVAYGGMRPKLKACWRAAQAGTVCRIVDGRIPQAAGRAVEGCAGGSTVHPARR